MTAFASPPLLALRWRPALVRRDTSSGGAAGAFSRRRLTPRACASSGERRNEPPLFVDTSGPLDLDSVSLRAPLTPEERAAVLRTLPRPVARFLIRRADEALSGEDSAETGGNGDRAAQLRKLRARRWLRAGDATGAKGEEGKDGDAVDEDDWYREYVRDGMDDGVMDEFGRAVEGPVFAPTPRVEGVERPLEGEVAVFAGGPTDAPEQAQTLAYGAISFVVAAIAFKILFAFLQFFVSFTFSFFAIFALSAGIFVFFFLLKF